jgi:hypothetical protein
MNLQRQVSSQLNALTLDAAGGPGADPVRANLRASLFRRLYRWLSRRARKIEHVCRWMYEHVAL